MKIGELELWLLLYFYISPLQLSSFFFEWNDDQMGVSKNRGTPKMDKLYKGKPY